MSDAIQDRAQRIAGSALSLAEGSYVDAWYLAKEVLTLRARISALEAAQQAGKLREAAQACVDHSYMKHQDPEVSIPKGYFDDLRAALGES